MKKLICMAGIMAMAAVTACSHTKQMANGVTNSEAENTKTLEAATDAFIKAMEDGDSVSLSRLTHSSLSYGHSGGGKPQNKSQFIHTFVTGASDFVKINITDQTISIVNNTGIVRHTLEADTNDNGHPGHVKLFILLVWQKQGRDWVLLARQAVRPPAS